MKKKKFIAGLLILFLISCLGIIVGYYKPMLGSFYPAKVAFMEMPVIRTASVLTLTCPLSLILAFRSSPNNYDKYTLELCAISMFFSSIAVLVFLPGRGEGLPGYLGDNILLMYAILVIAHLTTCLMLRKDFWHMARRENVGI